MTTESTPTSQQEKKPKVAYRGGPSDAVYAFGLFGAWIYYFTHATTIWDFVLGLFKGLFWPGFLVYDLLKFLGG